MQWAWQKEALWRENGFVVIGALENDLIANSINSDWHAGFHNNPWECWADTSVHSDREWDGARFQDTEDYLSGNDNRLTYADLVPVDSEYVVHSDLAPGYFANTNTMSCNREDDDDSAEFDIMYLSSWDDDYERIQVEVGNWIYGIED